MVELLDDEILLHMGFTKDEVKKIQEMVKKGKQYTDAMLEVKGARSNKTIVSKDPVKDVMANTIQSLSDIAIQKIDKDTPILVVRNGNGNQSMDMKTLLDFIEKNIRKDESKEVEELKGELRELKKLLEQREKAEQDEEIEMLDTKIEMKFAELKDELRKAMKPSPISSFDIGDFIKDLNEQGTLKDLINLAHNFVDMKKKDMINKSKFQLLERAMLISSNVRDSKEVEKIAKVLELLTKIYGTKDEGDYEIEEVESD